jgi:hypothetical protein
LVFFIGAGGSNAGQISHPVHWNFVRTGRLFFFLVSSRGPSAQHLSFLASVSLSLHKNVFYPVCLSLSVCTKTFSTLSRHVPAVGRLAPYHLISLQVSTLIVPVPWRLVTLAFLLICWVLWELIPFFLNCFPCRWCCADPYLNIDAGTMSPLEHGEVFVLDDGGEVRVRFTLHIVVLCLLSFPLHVLSCSLYTHHHIPQLEI